MLARAGGARSLIPEGRPGPTAASGLAGTVAAVVADDEARRARIGCLRCMGRLSNGRGAHAATCRCCWSSFCRKGVRYLAVILACAASSLGLSLKWEVKP